MGAKWLFSIKKVEKIELNRKIRLRSLVYRHKSQKVKNLTIAVIITEDATSFTRFVESKT